MILSIVKKMVCKSFTPITYILYDLTLGQGILFLRGQTDYGDSIEDEWVIVYILRELSKLFQDIWIKIGDSDGECLLVEAAKVLPRWLNPEVADNRVCSIF